MPLDSPQVTVSSTNGRKSEAAVREAVARHMAPIVERHKANGVNWAEKLLESTKDPRFSYAETMRSIRAMHEGMGPLRETITLSQVASSVDLATVHNVFQDYEDTPALYEAIAEVVTSNKLEEEYPEEWADDLPAKIGELEEAPEARVSGQSYRIRNFLYGRILSISKRAFENDDRGHIKSRASNFGKNYKRLIDRAFIYTLFRQMTTSNTNIPSTNILGQTSIVPSTAGPLTPQRIQDALTLGAFITDPFGEYITVSFNTLVTDSFDELNALRYLTSLYSPTGFPSGSTGYNVDTSPGAFTENILRGRLTVAHSSYVKQARASLSGTGMPSLVMEAKKGQIVQLRQDLQVTMENPDAGKSFLQRSFNWQGTIEFGTGNRNPRLFIVIN